MPNPPTGRVASLQGTSGGFSPSAVDAPHPAASNTARRVQKRPTRAPADAQRSGRTGERTTIRTDEINFTVHPSGQPLTCDSLVQSRDSGNWCAYIWIYTHITSMCVSINS